MGKESACSTEDTENRGSVPGQKDPLEKEMAAHSKHSSLKNPMDTGVWRAVVQRVGHNSVTKHSTDE